jgi:glycosyltransferase involved in cell wall biosynthesis
MIKILRIITRLNIGGPAIHTIILSRAFNRKAQYENILVCGSTNKPEGNMDHLLKICGVSPSVIPAMRREISFGNDIKSLISLYLIIKKERPQIVHTHTAKAGTLGRIAAIFAGVPIKIHTFHGHVFDGYFNPLKARLFIFIEKMLIPFTNRLIAVSESVRDELIDILDINDKNKIVVIPLGLELDRFLECEKRKGAFRKELGIREDVAVVGIVGRLVPIKNHKMFLDAAKIAVKDAPSGSIKFVIVGDGESRSTLEEYAKKEGLSGDVIFTGWREDLTYVYADMDIVALTSLNEGTPVSIIEALAAARPVISTSVGGVKDLIKDGVNGLLVRSNDHAELAKKISGLLADPLRRARLGANGRDSVMARYSKSRLVGDMESLYEGCLEKIKRR